MIACCATIAVCVLVDRGHAKQVLNELRFACAGLPTQYHYLVVFESLYSYLIKIYIKV